MPFGTWGLLIVIYFCITIIKMKDFRQKGEAASAPPEGVGKASLGDGEHATATSQLVRRVAGTTPGGKFSSRVSA